MCNMQSYYIFLNAKQKEEHDIFVFENAIII